MLDKDEMDKRLSLFVLNVEDEEKKVSWLESKECKGDAFMPFHRAQYDRRTGQSPNNPREQVSTPLDPPPYRGKVLSHMLRLYID
jgi:hypothetical protein